MQSNSKFYDILIQLSTWYVQAVLLAIVVILAYGHTLDVPFYLDDFSSIQENPVIYNWQGTLAELWHFSALRIVGYLTFALNYQIHQFQVVGYHLINILIHLLTGYAVLGLLRGLVRTPALNAVLSEEAKRWLPLVVALIFVLHPLQIQGVTYIVQRLASLAALFYITAMACFVQARLSTSLSPFSQKKQTSSSPFFKREKVPPFQKGRLGRIFWTLACLLFALLAFFTKQNTATLPIALLLIEFIFFPGNKRRLIFTGVGALIGLGIVWIILAFVFKQNPFSLEAMQALTRETTEISRTSYLATQMNVLWTYIGLFFWPASSHIDYHYPITDGFLSAHDNYHLIARILHGQVTGPLIGHLFLLGLAVYSLRRWQLVAFGIFFYYLAHAIESSLIPIRDVIFEHRTYLPNLGLAVLCAWLLVVKLPSLLNKTVIAKSTIQIFTLILILALSIVLGSATWFRNQMWRDPVALWQHNVEQSPEKKRAWIILGKHLIQNGQMQRNQGHLEQGDETIQKGIEALNKAIVRKTNPDGSHSMSVTTETALNMVVAYKMLRQYDKALKWVHGALARKQLLRPFDHAKFLVNQGNIFFELGRDSHKKKRYRKMQDYYRQSEVSYRQAIKIYPQNLKARINLASILATTRRFEEAIALYQEILAIDPSNVHVKQNLQKVQEARQKR